MLELLIGFVLGYVVCASMVKSAIKQALEEPDDDSSPTTAKAVVPTRLECVDGQYLLYNNDTNEFLGQGSDYKEMITNIRTRFAEFNFQVVAGDEETITTLKKQREEFLK